MKHGVWRIVICVQINLAALLALGSGWGLVSAPALAAETNAPALPATATPIKHIIVIIGENRSFDHVFGVYKPQAGQTVWNLLSKGIVNEDGSPGPHFAKAAQFAPNAPKSYFIATDDKAAYPTLPPPDLGGTPAKTRDVQPPFTSIAAAESMERDLAASDMVLLTTGASGLSSGGPDTRVQNVLNLPNGPFQITGPTLPYDAYTVDSVHRFYQMWQQSDCSVGHASPENPSGCLSDFYPFVASTSSARYNSGGASMGFYNMVKGDAPYLRLLADQYAMSDNHHQPQMGGSGVQHVFLALADAMVYSDAKDGHAKDGHAKDGHAKDGDVRPPSTQIANPDHQTGAAYYAMDGQYSLCADASQPGVGPILDYLAALPYHPKSNCEPGRYYLLNNRNPGYKPDGAVDVSPQAAPPSSLRSIGDAMMEKNISFRYYGGGYLEAVAGDQHRYCSICNPFQYLTSIMADEKTRTQHVGDVRDLLSDIDGGTLPAVSYVKPDWWVDGHPQSSKLNLFEAFVRNLVEKTQANPKLFAETAIIITFDEAGGYYDSGFIQPLDFFGDGPRTPFIVVSPFTKGGRVVHDYTDHASVVKFIERNWGLAPLTARSRDNLPNPKANPVSAYVPANMPAIGDLFDMFKFK
jgi:phospholipase C